jgi:kynurenine formamidase
MPSIAQLTESPFEVIDLGHPLQVGMPVAPTHPAFFMTLLRRHGDVVRDDGLTTANELITLSAHTGTHVDALGHASSNGAMHAGHTVEELQPDGRGLRGLGAESIPPIIARGVMLDVADHLGVACLEPGHGIDGAQLAAAAAHAGVDVGPGDVVLVRTGWGRYWDEPERYLGTDGLPGIDEDGARWLAERGVQASGSDTLIYEVVRPSHNVRPVHRLLLLECGIFIMEGMALDGLADAGNAEFLFVGLPLKIVGASGSPLRPVAIV